MNAAEYRYSVRQMLFDAAHERAGTLGSQEHGWLNQDSAHALERVAAEWPYIDEWQSRKQVLATIHHELSKTDNPLLRAMDPEQLADSVSRLEDLKCPT